jgi:hypothetical protein
MPSFEGKRICARLLFFAINTDGTIIKQFYCTGSIRAVKLHWLDKCLLYMNIIIINQSIVFFLIRDWYCTTVRNGNSINVDITWNTIKIKVITKLPNSEQSYKGKVKTHNYINRQNQSTTGKLWKRLERLYIWYFL